MSCVSSCKGEVERNVVWLEVMEMIMIMIMVMLMKIYLSPTPKHDSRTRLHSPHPTFALTLQLLSHLAHMVSLPFSQRSFFYGLFASEMTVRSTLKARRGVPSCC